MAIWSVAGLFGCGVYLGESFGGARVEKLSDRRGV